MAAAGTGGTLAVAALVLSAVAVFGGGDADPNVVADDPTTTTTAVTTTTVAEDPNAMTVQIEAGPPIRVEVVDPAQPVGEGTQQCLEVMAYPAGEGTDAPASYEGWDCRPDTGSGAKEVELRSTADAGGVQIDPEVDPVPSVGGCGQSVERYNPDAIASTGEAPGSTDFTLGGLPPGEYRLEVTANSGIGDGCAQGQADPAQERENSRSTAATVTVPGS